MKVNSQEIWEFTFYIKNMRKHSGRMLDQFFDTIIDMIMPLTYNKSIQHLKCTFYLNAWIFFCF